ncbi:histidine kinase [Bacillus luteolus]|uniref:histidine kinase n=1 Tax=Litchfieldia luteola TaxID=682179 RepID=A0ABR9QKU1_9BACI|nr:sensor histidine kinase [Cytobacillus luteolus]MBE4909127.1 histidine kinase [Cytobacillus luteolus]MBP1940422.1 two-component system sensor histidine kinase YesM [Cytobacillus luteolus]
MIKKSIRNKLIVLLLLTTIIPFGTSIVITYFHTKNYLEDQVVKENSNLLFQGRVNLENYINELNGLTLSLYNNPDFMNYLRNSNNTNNYLTIGIVKNVMQTILYAEDNINSVSLTFAEDNRIVAASKRSTVVFSRTINNEKKDIFQKAKESPFNMYIEPVNVNEARNKTISIHRSFTNVPSDEVLAYITLEITPENILEISSNLYNEGSEEFYLLSPEGTLIYSSNADISLNEKNQKWIDKMIYSNQEKGMLEWKEDAFNGVMIYDRIPDSAGGWYLVKRVPYTTLYESAFNVAKINIMFGGIGLLLVILATLFVSFKITSPIRILSQNIQQVEEGKMEVQFDSLGQDEIGILGNRFKQMVEKVNHLINREYRLQLENKTNQLKVLQSQLNPHFLYNALQSIGTVALKNNVPQIYTLVTHLSKIMRYGMNMEEDIVPLIKEINYTKAFLLLQKERFGEHLHYTIELEESISNVAVPKMLLQPIIENYFKHGFDIREGVGSINIECKQDEDDLVITVCDNGVGVSDQRLKEIYQYFEEGKRNRDEEESNIGLKNVYVRLNLYYEDRASLQLTNLENGGFAVTIKLPIHEEGMK